MVRVPVGMPKQERILRNHLHTDSSVHTAEPNLELGSWNPGTVPNQVSGRSLAFPTGMTDLVHAPDADRTRANTWAGVNQRIDRRAQVVVRWAAGGASADELSARIEALKYEPNIDRVLEAEAALTGLAGVVLAFGSGGRFLTIPGFVAAMLLLHAVQGWYPLLPLFRRLEIRTQDEIDKERYALKAIRGDFTGVTGQGATDEERAAAAWAAVCA
jgi:hypothetical protein